MSHSAPAADDRLSYSGLAAAELPTLDELGISLGRMQWRPFGFDEQGEAIDATSGPTRGVLAALRESVEERLEGELPAELAEAARSKRIEAAYQATLDRLVAMLNDAQPDRRYHITKDYLADPRHRFSYEFWVFLAEFARRISGDRELIFRGGPHYIPPAVARLSRPFGVQGTYRAITRLTKLVTKNSLEAVATSPSSATIRWPGTLVPTMVPRECVPAYYALACQAFRGSMGAIPRVIGGLATGHVTQTHCIALGARYCEWVITWRAEPSRTDRRAFAVAAGASVTALAAAALRAPGSRLAGALAAAALPLAVALGRQRIRQLTEGRDAEHRLLLEQRELSETEYGIRTATYTEIQQTNLELQRRVAELTTLNEVGRAVSSTLDLEALLDASLAALVEHGGYERGLVLLHDPERDVLTGGRSFGGSAEEMAAVSGYEVDLRREGSILGRILRSDRPIVVTDVARQGDEQARALATHLDTTSFLGTPLVSQGRKLGVLAVDHGRRGPVPDEADSALVFTVGSLIASAVETATLYKEVERTNRELEERVRRRTAQLAEATEQAEAAQSQAEAANEAKSRFLSNVSHELRTPLTSVLGFAKIIGERLDEVILPAVDMTDARNKRAARQVRDNISIIVTEGERLTTMINNVLDLAKIESGWFEWQDDEIGLPELLEHGAQATSSLFAAKGIELRTEVADGLPTVRGDHDRLLQVVINLLSNAVKFTDQGWVEMRAIGEADEILVSVTDTGAGLAAEDHATAFEQFRQVGDTLTDKPRGTGLGLPISREIVEHHGGRMWLESELGRGSTFWFSLPLRSEPQVPAPVAAGYAGGDDEPTDGADRKPIDGAPLVLVVDDDASTRELLRQELEAGQYAVMEAVDGRSALSLARNASPSLVVLDVVMPEPDGFDVAAALKADPATEHIPILMVTVLDAEERARQTGVEAFVGKPFGSDKLMAEVARLSPPVVEAR
jgi:signal transduction histidine kinase